MSLWQATLILAVCILGLVVVIKRLTAGPKEPNPLETLLKKLAESGEFEEPGHRFGREENEPYVRDAIQWLHGERPRERA